MSTSIFDIPPFTAYRPGWVNRCNRYQLYRLYYEGKAYDSLRWTQDSRRLYEGTRTLFSPLKRSVRVDVAKIPAGWALPKEASETTKERIKELRRLCCAEREYQKFVRFAAVVGEAALMIGGTPQEPKPQALRADEVIMGVIKPSAGSLQEDVDAATLGTAEGDLTAPNPVPAVGTPFALIVKRTTTTGMPYLGQDYSDPLNIQEYAQLITPTEIKTYKDGQLHDYDGMGSVRPNAFGFIPVHFGRFDEAEDGTGDPAFGGVLELLDRVNEIASLTLDTIARNAEPLLVGTGVTDIERDEENDTITTPKADAKFYTVNPNLAIAETLAFIQDVRSEFKTLLPQLRLDELGAASDLAYDTVITLLMELGDHIVSVRTNVDEAIETVERWMLGASGEGIPDDYEIDRDRSWIALTESQQLDLEAKRLANKSSEKALTAPPPPAPGATGKETSPNGEPRAAGQPGAAGSNPGSGNTR